MPTNTEHYSIGDLSRRTQVKIDTIRYYERVGLLPNPPRTHGGQRVYGDVHCKLLEFVKRGRQLGFALSELRTLVEAGGPGVVTCADTQRVAAAHLSRVRAALETLMNLERVLAGTVEQCSGETIPSCAVIDLLTCAGDDHSIEPISDAPVG